MKSLDELDDIITKGSTQLEPADVSDEIIVKEISDKEYFSDKDAWSNSMAKELRSDCIGFDRWYRGDFIRPCDDKFANGQYLHDCMAKLCTDGEYKSECEFLIMPKFDRRTKVGKADYEKFISGVNLDAVYVVDETDAAKIESLAIKFFESKWFPKLTDTMTEMSFTSSYKGVRIKGKIDYAGTSEDGQFTVIDWKSTSFFNEFERKAQYLLYNQQAAWYNRLTNCDKFMFVVFDTVNFDRFKIVNVKIDGEFMRTGRIRMDESIVLINEYLENGIDSPVFNTVTL